MVLGYGGLRSANVLSGYSSLAPTQPLYLFCRYRADKDVK